MAFDILGTAPAVTLRNWLTYVLRACIHQQETLAYHNQRGLGNELDVKRTYNARLRREILQNFQLYLHTGRMNLFEKYYGQRRLCEHNSDCLCLPGDLAPVLLSPPPPLPASSQHTHRRPPFHLLCLLCFYILIS